MSIPRIVAVLCSGYALVMALLLYGTRAARAQARERAARGAPRVTPRGWPGLIRRVVTTMLGGYALLLVVVVGYYHAVARVGGGFLVDAVTGSAMLTALALPVFLALSWLAERRHRTRRKPVRPARTRRLQSPA